MNKEQTKRILGFLMLRPAISSRNLTSLVLVGLFFGVYVAAGGKVEGIPAVQSNTGGFGTVDKTAPIADPSQLQLNNVQPQTQPGLDTSRLQFGKKPGDDKDAAANAETEKQPPAAGSGLDSLTDRLNKVGSGRRPQ